MPTSAPPTSNFRRGCSHNILFFLTLRNVLCGHKTSKTSISGARSMSCTKSECTWQCAPSAMLMSGWVHFHNRSVAVRLRHCPSWRFNNRIAGTRVAQSVGSFNQHAYRIVYAKHSPPSRSPQILRWKTGNSEQHISCASTNAKPHNTAAST